jgi:hypothetical protein
VGRKRLTWRVSQCSPHAVPPAAGQDLKSRHPGLAAAASPSKAGKGKKAPPPDLPDDEGEMGFRPAWRCRSVGAQGRRRGRSA